MVCRRPVAPQDVLLRIQHQHAVGRSLDRRQKLLEFESPPRDGVVAVAHGALDAVGEFAPQAGVPRRAVLLVAAQPAQQSITAHRIHQQQQADTRDHADPEAQTAQAGRRMNRDPYDETEQRRPEGLQQSRQQPGHEQRWRSGGERVALLGQAVTGATDGLDHARALHALQRFAQALDMNVDRALLDEHMVTPDAVQQLRTAVHTLGVGHQEMQQTELGGTQLHLDAVAADPTRARIQQQGADLDRAVQRLGRLAAQHSANAGEQLIGREGLGDVVVGTRIQTGDLVAFLGTGREHDDGQLLRPDRAAPLAREGHAALAWQHPVEHDEIGQHPVNLVLGLRGIAGQRDLEAGMAQIDGDQLGDRRLVFHHQDSTHSRLLFSGPWSRRPPACCAGRPDP
mmetsp:Transcript_53282/g.124970  ORF Transcript_53282/g.124970 Transcript_53282/m.124970 type:complete len:398 (-) Transcript_53282:451-1644(-)